MTQPSLVHPNTGGRPQPAVVRLLYRATSGLLLAAVLAALLLTARGWHDQAVLTTVSFVLAAGGAFFGLALAGRAWVDWPGRPAGPTILLLIATAGLVAATGGAESRMASLPILVVILDSPFRRRLLPLALTGAACLAAPLVYAFNWHYAVLTVFGWATIAVGTWAARRMAAELGRTDRQARELHAISRASQIAASLDLQSVMDSTVAAVRELLGPDAVLLYLTDPDGQTLKPACWHFDPTKYTAQQAAAVASHVVQVGTGIVGSAALAGEPLLLPDVSQDPRAVRIPGAHSRPLTYMLVPLVCSGKLLGILRLSRDGIGRFTHDDLTLATILASQASMAIANSGLFAATKRAEQAARDAESRYDRLTQFAGTAIATLDLEQHRIVHVNEAMEQLIGYSREELSREPHSLAHLLDDASEALVNACAQAFREGADVAREVVLTWRARDGRRVVMEHTMVPLRDGAGDMPQMETIARDITERQRLESEIEHLTYHDRLTGVHNRAFFEQALARLDQPQHLPLTIVMGDINGLKLINDAFGHRAGDRVLEGSAKVLGSVLRQSDIICRWGGDEFAMLLPRLEPAAATEVLDRIRLALADMEPEPIPLSMALGMATKKLPEQDVATVIKEAEDRMYRNKLLESRSMHESIVSSLEQTLRHKTNETEEHTLRLRELAALLGREMNLSKNQLNDLSLLAALHDVGKVGIPDNVLNNPGVLSVDDWEIMMRHPEIGYRIAMACPSLAAIATLILSHHEHWDGQGYPRGLAGGEIPLPARILAVADAFEVMTTGRPYRKPLTPEAALAELARCAGSQFDPEVVRAMGRVWQAPAESQQDQSDRKTGRIRVTPA